MTLKHFLVASAVGSILLTAFSGPAPAHDLVWPGEKLALMHPAAESFEQRNLYVSDAQRAAIERTIGSSLPEEDLKPSIYLAVVRKTPESRPRKAAAMMFIDAWGSGGKIEMGVVVGGAGTIERIHIFENDETPAILDRGFLGQFVGKKADDPFVVGKDVRAPAIDPKTARAIASGARRGIVIINEMFRRKN